MKVTGGSVLLESCEVVREGYKLYRCYSYQIVCSSCEGVKVVIMM